MGTRIGFALNIHYCGTHIAEISLASSPSDCGMEDTANNQYPENPNFAKASCCADETVLYQNQEPQKKEAVSVLQVFDDFFALAVKSEPTFSAKSPNLSPQITGYPPPLRDIKIYLLNQSIVVYE
jgi:hypothetical protein